MPVPGEQLGDLSSRMIGDPAEHISKVGLRVDGVKLGGFDQRVHGRGTSAAGIRSGKEVILAAMATPRSARSAGLLSRAKRPSSKQRTSAGQRARIESAGVFAVKPGPARD